MEHKKLNEMVSQHAYDEIISKIKENVGERAAQYIIPSVIKALEEGDGKTREEILNSWLSVDSCRVCSTCGAIMEEGWYLDCNGYACSDECAAKSEGITMEEFDKWRIYKGDIEQYLIDNNDSRDISQLSRDECDYIINEVCQDCEYCYTEWY